MLFYKEHKDDMKCLQCGKSRFVEVIKEDGEKVMTKVAHKQLRYMPLTPQMKWLFLSKKTTRHMRWHKEGVRENDQVMVHPSDSEAWKALEHENISLSAVPIRYSPLSPSCPVWSHIKSSSIYSNSQTKPSMNQHGIEALISFVEHATRLLPLVYILCIAILMDYHHDRVKGDMERVVMHSRVSLNSYNINAQVNYKVTAVIR
jgi:hypothetical protein